MKLRTLIDEQPTKQDVHLTSLGDLYTDEFDDDDEPSFGADPFDILAYREEQGELS